MSRWIRGIYNAAANFNLSNALRATSVGRVGRDKQHLRKEHEQSNKCGESCQSDKPCKSDDATSTGSGTCPCTSDRIVDTIIIGNDVVITNSSDICDEQCHKCHPTFCDHIERDYSEYTSYTATIRTEGQGAGSRIRVSAEPRYNKQSNSITTDPVEHITGIQSGVTI